MKKITINIRPDHESGGFNAWWDDPRGGGITTQGETIPELHDMIRDAVELYFGDRADRPESVGLHFVEDPTMVLAAK